MINYLINSSNSNKIKKTEDPWSRDANPVDIR